MGCKDLSKGVWWIDLWRISPASKALVPSLKCLWEITWCFWMIIHNKLCRWWRGKSCITFWTAHFFHEVSIGFFGLSVPWKYLTFTNATLNAQTIQKIILPPLILIRHLQSLLCYDHSKNHFISHWHLTNGARALKVGHILQRSIQAPFF